MIHPDDAPCQCGLQWRVWRPPHGLTWNTVSDQNGDYRWLSNHMSVVKDGRAGRFIAAATFATSPSRSKPSARFGKAKPGNRALFDNSIDAIFATAPDGRVFAANQVACQTFGMTEEELIRAGRQGITDWSDPRHGPALAERARSGHLRRELGYVSPRTATVTARESAAEVSARSTGPRPS